MKKGCKAIYQKGLTLPNAIFAKLCLQFSKDALNLRAGIEETVLARSHAVAQEVVVGLEVGGNGQPGPVWGPPVIRHGVDKQVSGFGAGIVG